MDFDEYVLCTDTLFGSEFESSC